MNGEILNRVRRELRRSSTAGPLALATVVGLLTGFGAIGLRWMISAVQWLFFDQGGRLSDVLAPLPAWVPLVLAPAIGMVVVSWMVRRWAPVLAAAQNYTEVAGENVTLGGPVVRAARRRV